MERLHQEVAYIAYYLHWSYDAVMGLEHRERHQWVGQITHINAQLNEQAGTHG